MPSVLPAHQLFDLLQLIATGTAIEDAFVEVAQESPDNDDSTDVDPRDRSCPS